MHVDKLGQRRLELGEIVERIAEAFELSTGANGFGGGRLVVERDLEPAAALGRAPASRVVDRETTHGARRVGEEPGAVHERDVLASRDVQIRLVDQRRGSERERRTSSTQARLGQLVELIIEEGKQGVGIDVGMHEKHGCWKWTRRATAARFDTDMDRIEPGTLIVI